MARRADPPTLADPAIPKTDPVRQVLRVPIGVSDFSIDAYTYDNTGTKPDPDLTEFNLNESNTGDIYTMVHEAFKINPELVVIGTPWAPPIWMKNR